MQQKMRALIVALVMGIWAVSGAGSDELTAAQDAADNFAIRIEAADQNRLDEENSLFSSLKDRVPEVIRKMLVERGVYGKDNRLDWGELSDAAVKKVATASVAIFVSGALTGPDQGKYKLDGARTLGSKVGLCPDERYTTQTAIAYCSGTLVKENVVLTAGHCVGEVKNVARTPQLKSLRFVFGYVANEAQDGGRLEFDARQVYVGKQVLGGVYDSAKEDWAAIELDRAVPADIAVPVTYSATPTIRKGDSVYALGYPSGLPLKYAPGAEVRDDSDSAFFVANLNTFQGNSGSGVYVGSSNLLVGILVRGAQDYYRDASAGCNRVYVCPRDGCKGESVTRLSMVRIP